MNWLIYWDEISESYIFEVMNTDIRYSFVGANSGEKVLEFANLLAEGNPQFWETAVRLLNVAEEDVVEVASSLFAELAPSSFKLLDFDAIVFAEEAGLLTRLDALAEFILERLAL